MDGWNDAETLQTFLGIGRSTFFRRVQAGVIEAATIGGSRFYRLLPAGQDGTSPTGPGRTTSGPVPQTSPTDTGPDGTDRAGLLALVSKYETRIDALLVDHQAATREAREARERAAALAVELEAARGQVALVELQAEHARQLAERERAREAAALEAARLEAERVREAAARAVEAARLEAERERATVEAAHVVEVERLRTAEASAREAATADLEDASRAREAAHAVAQEERKRREAAEARAEAVEALAALAWWRFGAKRRARAVLEGRMLGR